MKGREHLPANDEILMEHLDRLPELGTSGPEIGEMRLSKLVSLANLYREETEENF